MQYNATRKKIRYDTIRYDTIRYDTIRYNAIRYDTIRYDTIRYDTIRYDTIRYDTIRYDTIRYDTIRYDTKSHLFGIGKNNIFYIFHIRYTIIFLSSSMEIYRVNNIDYAGRGVLIVRNIRNIFFSNVRLNLFISVY